MFRPSVEGYLEKVSKDIDEIGKLCGFLFVLRRTFQSLFLRILETISILECL